MTDVVNFQDVKQHWNSRAGTWDSKQFVYIGRANRSYYLPASKWANPFPVMRARGESEALAHSRARNAYREHLQRHPELLADIGKLRGKTLVCWCLSADECHGGVLLEFLGERAVEAQPEQVAQIGMDGSAQPVLAWDRGGAAFRIEQNRHGVLYRTNVKNGQPVGIPGKVYTDWCEWRRDAFKLTLRVHGAWARFRYEMRLKNMVGRCGDERMNIEALILQELLAELDGEL